MEKKKDDDDDDDDGGNKNSARRVENPMVRSEKGRIRVESDLPLPSSHPVKLLRRGRDLGYRWKNNSAREIRS